MTIIFVIGHSYSSCSALAPEYAKAAGILAEKDSPIKLAKVDATEEGPLAEKFEVRGYPTLKFFRNGKPMEYGGGRTADTIVSWVEKKTGPPAKALANADEAAAFTEGKNVAVVGCFADETTDAAKAFLAVASSLDDLPFGIMADCSGYDVSGEGVVVIKTFDDGKATLTEDLTEENIAKFASSESLPLVIDFNHETAQKIFSGEVKSHFLLFSSAKADDHESKVFKYFLIVVTTCSSSIYVLLSLSTHECNTCLLVTYDYNQIFFSSQL